MVDLNILLLGSYDVLIDMDRIESHEVAINCFNKKFTCIDKIGKLTTIVGIPRAVSTRKLSAMQVKKCVRKVCTLYAIHVLEAKEEDKPDLEILQC